MITSLTDEQMARMSEIRNKWRRYGLSCEPADRTCAEQGIVEAYRVAELPAPQIVWCASPLAGLAARTEFMARTKKGNGRQSTNTIAGECVKDKVLHKTNCRVRSNIWRNVRKSIWHKVNENVGEEMEPSHWNIPAINVKRGVWSNVGARILERIEDSWGQYGNSFKYGFPESRYYGFHDAIFGQHNSDWLANIDFFKSIAGLNQETSDLNCLLKIAQSAGWFWPYENVCWICERTESVHLDENEELHNLRGAAVSYPDGWKLYASHGVLLPDWIMETPDQISPSKIDKEQNAEIRRVMIELFGQERYLKEGGSQLIGSGSCGRLWKKEIRDDEPIVMVEILNSTPEKDGSLSVRAAIATFGEDAQVNHDGMMMRLGGVPDGLRFKSYFLRVPPTCRTPKEAVAWTFNKKESEYELIVQS